MMEWDNGNRDEPNTVIIGYQHLKTEEFHVDLELSTSATQERRDQFEQSKIIAKLARDTAQAIVDGRLRVPPEMVQMAQQILDGDTEGELSEDSLGNILQQGVIDQDRKPKRKKELTTGMYL